MMKYLFFVILLCGWWVRPLNLQAQATASYIHPDSIAFLSQDLTNLHVAPKMARPDIVPHPLEYAHLKKVETAQCLATSHETAGLPPVYADLLKVRHAMERLVMTQQASFADSIENLLYNRLLPLLHTAGSEQQSAAQAIADLSQTLLMTQGDTIFVNGYLNSWAHLVTPTLQLTLDQITGMPFLPRIKIRVNNIASQTPFTIGLRIPYWQKDLPTFYVNGRKFDGQCQNGYFMISRRWNSGDEIYADFDFSLQLLTPHLCRRGPLLFQSAQALSDPNELQAAIDDNNQLYLEGKGKRAYYLFDFSHSPKGKR